MSLRDRFKQSMINKAEATGVELAVDAKDKFVLEQTVKYSRIFTDGWMEALDEHLLIIENAVIPRDTKDVRQFIYDLLKQERP